MVRNLRCRDARRHRGGWLDGIRCGCAEAGGGQCGNWDSSPVELGIRTGAYARHGIEVEALCTQGTGETQQAVIAGSADIGIGVGTLGALGAFAKGAPIRIISGSATGNADSGS